MEISSIGSMSGMTGMQGMKPPPPPPEGETASDFMSKLDADGDGQLSSAEFSLRGSEAGSAESTEAFDAMDTNEDGFVSQEELEADMASRLDAMKAKLESGGLGGMAQGSDTDSYQQLLEMVGSNSDDAKARGADAYRQMQQEMYGAASYGSQSFSSGLDLSA